MTTKIVDITKKKKTKRHDTLPSSSSYYNLNLESILQRYGVEVKSKVKFKDTDTAEEVNKKLLLAQLLSLAEMIPVAEAAYKKSPGQSTAYAFTNLSNAIIVVIKELEARTDNTVLVENINKEVIQPLLTNMLQAYSRNIDNLKKAILNMVPRKDRSTIENMFPIIIQNFAADSKKMYEDSSTSLKQLINKVKR